MLRHLGNCVQRLAASGEPVSFLLGTAKQVSVGTPPASLLCAQVVALFFGGHTPACSAVGLCAAVISGMLSGEFLI